MSKRFIMPKNPLLFWIPLALFTIIILFLIYVRFFAAVAKVNNHLITQAEYISELKKETGIGTLDTMITREIILQEADKRKLTVSSKEVEDRIVKVGKRYATQGIQLESLLQKNHLTHEDFRYRMKIQLLLEKILAKEITVTDVEINDILARNSELVTKTPNKADLIQTLKDELRQKKLDAVFITWLPEVKKNYKIEIYL